MRATPGRILSGGGRVRRAVTDGADSQAALSAMFEAVCGYLGWQMGILWQVDAKEGVLRCVHFWHAPDKSFARLKSITTRRGLGPGKDLPGRVWAAGKPLWARDLLRESRGARPIAASRKGLRAALGVPIRISGEVVGVIEFLSHEIREPDKPLLRLMATAGRQFGQLL